MGYILKCNKCGYERLITVEWLIGLKGKLLSTDFVATIENLNELIPRLQCSKCKWKDAIIFREKVPEKRERESDKRRTNLPKFSKKLKGSAGHVTKVIPYPSPDLTRWKPPSKSISQKKSMYKKTCYFCNGTGANGNCFHCEGTGWE